MKYAITRVMVTKAKDAVDGKVHRHKLYYAGRDNLCGLGCDNWYDRKHAKLFDDDRIAERYARALDGKVEEVKA